MGCMRKLGCLVVLALVAVALFLTRASWLHFVPGHRAGSATAAADQTWQALTPVGARRARAAVEQLRSPRGPGSVTVAPGDLAAYIFEELSKSLPPSADSIEAAAIGERLYVRAVIKTSDLGATGALGPLAALLGDRERIQLGGVLRIIRPGIAELQVKEMKLGNLRVPAALIPRLVKQISRGIRPPELAPDGLPLQTPNYISDVQVSNGRITLYKTLPAR